MASGSQNMTTDKARILSTTPDNTTTFLRGDNTWSNTLTGPLNLTGTTSGIIINASVSTTPTTTTGTALSYTRLQSHSNLFINANTDNSGTEYVILTAGKGMSSTTTDGLYVGTSTMGFQSIMKILDGCLSLFPTSNGYREGIRIHSAGSWSDITLCGNDNTGDSGISANSWFIGNNNGNFHITRNGSSGDGNAYLRCVSNVWAWNGTANGNISGNAASATYSTRLETNTSTTSSDPGGLTWFNISAASSTTVNTNDTPSSSDTWWYILRNRHTNTTNNYYTDLAIPFNANSIYYKVIRNNAIVNNGWVRVLDALNYNDYAPTKTGSGASGSWGISITGNASTATTWQTARTLTIGATGKSVNGSANVSWSMNEIMGSSDSSKFYRGDKTWSNTIVGSFNASSSGSNRANINMITVADQPNDFYLGNNNASKWSITSRASNESYNLYVFSTASGIGFSTQWEYSTGKFYMLHGAEVTGDLTVTGTINNYKFSTQSSLNADDIRTSNGCWIVNAAITNAPTTNHGALMGIASVGTPCQMFFADNQLYVYKRWYTSGAWNTWQKMSAGYADSAGTASKILDSNNSTAITMSYASGGVSSFNWATVWNGYHLTYISKADLMSQIRGAASGSWGISVTGNASATETALQGRGILLNYGFQTANASTWNSWTATNQFGIFTNWWDSSNTKMPYMYGSGIIIPHLDANYRSALYARCDNYGLWYGYSSDKGVTMNWREVVLNSGTWGISITGNAATATTLQTSRNIWGQSFNGSAAITGKFLMNGDDGSLAFYTVDGNHGCGNETVVIQSCFDGQDPQTSGYTSSYTGRCNIALQPRGGQVYVGSVPPNGNAKSYKLYVTGGLNVSENVAITATAGARYLLMGNQDSAGVNNPVVFCAANGTLYLGNGNSWASVNGGGCTEKFYMDTNHVRLVSRSAEDNYSAGAALEIREVNYATTSQSSDAYAPKIGFHWGGRYGNYLSMQSDGWFKFGGAGYYSSVRVANLTAFGTVYANGGYLQTTMNGHTLTIGAQNTDWCHFTTNTGVSFYFGSHLYVNGTIGIYGANTYMNSQDIVANRYLYCAYVNESCGVETPDTNSNWIYANSDGWLRKSTNNDLVKSTRLGYYQSGRDFTNGTLVETDISYPEYGDAFYLKIEGNSYNAGYPFYYTYQGYIYYNTVVNNGGIGIGPDIANAKIIKYNNHLCFWWPRQGYWQGFSVFCAAVTSKDSYGMRNRVISVTDTAQPTSDHEQAMTFRKFWYRDETVSSANTSASCTGNAASATKLQTARSLWGQSFDGTGNISGTIYISASAGNFSEGIRIKPYSSWSTIVLGGNDLSADSGTSANSWSIHNNNGSFYITRNGSDSSGSALFGCVGNVWRLYTSANMPSGSGNMSAAAIANNMTFYRNGIVIPNPGTVNDGGFVRVKGSGESDTILELGTWDDYGTGETIQFNYYPTTSQITPTYSVSVPKASGTICLTNGTGASGTWGISISGNAATASTAGSASKLSINNSANESACLQYMQTSGQTSGGDLPWSDWFHVLKMNHGTGDTYFKRLLAFGFWDVHHVYTAMATSNGATQEWKKVWIEGDSVTGAVWNDYAEARESHCTEPGRTVYEIGDDTLELVQERLAPCAGIISDTWGFSQGETERAKTHIAVAGRVLAYPYQDRDNYKPGDVLCSAPGGTVDIMTQEEIRNFPDRIIGIVSCVPTYDTWGSGDRDPVQVNGRIWVKVQ